MFTVSKGMVFFVEWDYDLAANPGCTGFVGKVLDANHSVVARSAWAVDRNMRRAAFACGVVGTFSVVVQAIDANGVEGYMSSPVPITVVDRPSIPNPEPPPVGQLGAPTNVRLSAT